MRTKNQTTSPPFFLSVLLIFEKIFKLLIALSSVGSLYLLFMVFLRNVPVLKIYEKAFNLGFSNIFNQLVNKNIKSFYFWPSFPVFLALSILALFLLRYIKNILWDETVYSTSSASTFKSIIKMGMMVSALGSLYLTYLVFSRNIDFIGLYKRYFGLSTTQLKSHLSLSSVYFWSSFPLILMGLATLLIVMQIFGDKGERVNLKTGTRKRTSKNRSKPDYKKKPVVRKRTSSNEGNIFPVLCHLSTIIGFSIILPVIVLLVKGRDSEFVNYNAKEALNFQLNLIFFAIMVTLLIIAIVGGTFVGFLSGNVNMALGVSLFGYLGIGLLYFVLFLFVIISAITGTIKSSRGSYFRYPFIIRLIR